jgi:hypothetical protein
MQLLAPEAHSIEVGHTPVVAAAVSAAAERDEAPQLAERVQALELELARLRNAIGKISGELGMPNPLD